MTFGGAFALSRTCVGWTYYELSTALMMKEIYYRKQRVDRLISEDHPL